MFCWPCVSIHPCDKNQLDTLFILSLFHQSTSTFFGNICSPSSGGILYIYNKLVRVLLFGWLSVGQQIVNWKAQHVPIAVYIHYTSWWWATNIPEICRGCSGEISPTRYKNCVFYSQWLYSTCFGWQSHPSSGVQCCIWPQVSWLT